MQINVDISPGANCAVSWSPLRAKGGGYISASWSPSVVLVRGCSLAPKRSKVNGTS